MEERNWTTVTNFILLGLTKDPTLQLPLFVFFFLVYFLTVIGNVGLIVIVWSDPHLHTPMYFFLGNLSLIDFCYSSAITPKMLMGFLVESNTISFNGCAMQLFSFCSLSIAESLLIAVMAFDRYTAICKPLHYMPIMTKMVCIELAAVPYAGGVVCALIYTVTTFKLPFCADNKVAHYFCDVLPLFKLSCVDTTFNVMLMYSIVIFISLCSLPLLGVSYTYIIRSILRIRSSKGRQRVFSTCSSHFVSIVLLYGAGVYMYLSHNISHSDKRSTVISVFYTIMISMLNPLIYSLRNQDVKAALSRLSLKLNKRRSHEL